MNFDITEKMESACKGRGSVCNVSFGATSMKKVGVLLGVGEDPPEVEKSGRGVNVV